MCIFECNRNAQKNAIKPFNLLRIFLRTLNVECKKNVVRISAHFQSRLCAFSPFPLESLATLPPQKVGFWFCVVEAVTVGSEAWPQTQQEEGGKNGQEMRFFFSPGVSSSPSLLPSI